jgi:hypothetical protein
VTGGTRPPAPFGSPAAWPVSVQAPATAAQLYAELLDDWGRLVCGCPPEAMTTGMHEAGCRLADQCLGCRGARTRVLVVAGYPTVESCWDCGGTGLVPGCEHPTVVPAARRGIWRCEHCWLWLRLIPTRDGSGEQFTDPLTGLAGNVRVDVLGSRRPGGGVGR